MSNNLVIANRVLRSRLMIGTGKFSSNDIMKKAILASGAEIVTVAVRRVDFDDSNDDILNHIDKNDFLFLPNTSGAIDADEAVRLARLARASGIGDWVKLEVTPDPYHLLPCPTQTLKAAEILVKEGFKVLPYINADAILAKQLEDIGCVTVMPLASPIGTNKGLSNRDAIGLIIERAKIPVVVDAGIGKPSHAAEAIEMGADAVLVNTAIAIADDPVKMAEAFALAVRAGFMAREAGLAKVKNRAESSSPLTNFLRDM